jgi:hypothetical protein
MHGTGQESFGFGETYEQYVNGNKIIFTEKRKSLFSKDKILKNLGLE